MGIPTGDVCMCVCVCVVCGSSRATTVLFLAVMGEVWLHHQGQGRVSFPTSSSSSFLSLCPSLLSIHCHLYRPHHLLLMRQSYFTAQPDDSIKKKRKKRITLISGASRQGKPVLQRKYLEENFTPWPSNWVITWWIEVWKCLDYRLHCDADVEDSASMQRQSIIKSLQPQLNNKVTLWCCSHALNCWQTLGYR